MRYFHPAAPNELQCDLDNDAAFAVFRNGVRMLKESLHVKVVKVIVHPSATQGHRHGIVVMEKPMALYERIALQLALGDDPVRGMMNWGRARNDDPNPIILIDDRPSFKDKDAQKRMSCDCGDTERLPRCKHLRVVQSSKAEFLPRGK